MFNGYSLIYHSNTIYIPRIETKQYSLLFTDLSNTTVVFVYTSLHDSQNSLNNKCVYTIMYMIVHFNQQFLIGFKTFTMVNYYDLVKKLVLSTWNKLFSLVQPFSLEQLFFVSSTVNNLMFKSVGNL